MLECLAGLREDEDTLPASMHYAINGLRPEGWGASFFTDAFRGLSGADRDILRRWSSPKKSKDLLWIGCTDRMTPRSLEESLALKGAAKFGGPDDCCGVWALQAGLLDEGYRVARRLLNRLRENTFERLVVGCGHCQKVFTWTMPRLLGIELPFPVVSIYEYLLERIEQGAAAMTQPAHLDAVISDPCFGYENGKAYLDAVRAVGRAAGMTLSELPHNRESALCCGYGGLFMDGRVKRVVSAARVKRRDLAAGGKKHVVSYCPGCHLLNHYFQPGYDSRYLLEEVLKALGDPVTQPLSTLHRRLVRPRMAWHLMGTTKSALW
jgi:Fe-S oxidoreductase